MKVQTVIEQLLFSTVRIETDISVGTGFLFSTQLNTGGTFTFLITNKHVIKGAKQINFFLTKAEKVVTTEQTKKNIIPKMGEKYECSLDNYEWFNHPNKDIDLTMINLSPILNKMYREGKNIFIITIPIELIPTQEMFYELDALENIIFIGYPEGIYDSKNLFPIIRRGITATPIYSDYEGKSLFLIDASVFPGSSGSPVFIFDKGNFNTRDGATHIGNRIYFCGVISQTIKRDESGRLKFIEIPTQVKPIIQISQMIDLGVVIKSGKVKELLELYLEELNKKNRKTNE